MTYTAWNQLIGKHFFNEVMAEKEVFLFMSKEELISIAKPFFDIEEYSDDNYILRDFISATKKGVEGAIGTFLEKADYAYRNRNKIKIELNENEVQYPLYLSYLILLVMPLTETLADSINANNYYSRLNTFIGADKDRHFVNSINYTENKIYRLWDNLEEWTIDEFGGTLGLFFHRRFSHKHWINVGTMFSQCILPPRSFRNFSVFFSKYNFIPHYEYPAEFFKHKLASGGSQFLQLPKYINGLFNNDSGNELVEKLLEITQREYRKWDGNIISEQESLFNYDGSTTVRVFLQLRYSKISESISFSYRIGYQNDFPDDLVLNGHEIYEEMNSFSNTLEKEFNPQFTLQDEFNKWRAIFQEKEIRLFINASYYQLENSYWLETDNLSKVDQMLIMCTANKRQIIENWLRKECSNVLFDINNYNGLPHGYYIYSFRGVRNSLVSETCLLLKKDKQISLISDLKLDYRTYLRVILPEVLIGNADGSEEVFLEYKESNDSIVLKRIEGTNKWLLPENIRLNEEFKIKIVDQKLYQNFTNYKIVSADDTALQVFEENSPLRDKFGNVTNEQIDCYLRGNEIGGVNFGKQYAYNNGFKSNRTRKHIQINEAIYTHKDGNILLSFLTIRGNTKAKDFFDAFEFLSSKKINKTQNRKFYNLAKAKKLSLNYFDYLGFIDYDYYADKIIINPPQLIYIPSAEGRTALLIGARDNALVKQLISTASKFNLQVEITPQNSLNEDLLLPDRIVIHAFQSDNDKYGERAINNFAKELNIKFNNDRLHQIGLFLLSGNVSEYENFIVENNETDDNYNSASKYIFDSNSLALSKFPDSNFEKELSLIEYKFREWERFQVLWLHSKCYDVDRNWGRFIVLKHLNKNIMLYDRNKKSVAIPVKTPLPRLLFESITLMSGFAPITKKINYQYYWIFDNIESNYIKDMMKKIGQEIIEQEIN